MIGKKQSNISIAICSRQSYIVLWPTVTGAVSSEHSACLTASILASFLIFSAGSALSLVVSPVSFRLWISWASSWLTSAKCWALQTFVLYIAKQVWKSKVKHFSWNCLKYFSSDRENTDNSTIFYFVLIKILFPWFICTSFFSRENKGTTEI